MVEKPFHIFDIRIDTRCDENCGWFKSGPKRLSFGMLTIIDQCNLFDVELVSRGQHWDCEKMCKRIEKEPEWQGE